MLRERRKCEKCFCEFFTNHDHQGPARRTCDGCSSRRRSGRCCRIYHQKCSGCGVSFCGTKRRFHSNACRKSSRKRRIHPCVCVKCGVDFMGFKRTAKYCHAKCRQPPTQMRTCMWCGIEYKPDANRYGQKFCGREHAFAYKSSIRELNGRPKPTKDQRVKQNKAIRDSNQRRKAVIRGSAAEKIDCDVVFDRDGWTCKLCGEPVNRSVAAPHRSSPSIDHIIPLSKGGSHTYDNVQCAHFGCNSRKGNRQTADLKTA